MNIKWRKPIERLLDETQQRRVVEAISLINPKAGHAIDSYKMGKEGPRISSIFLVTNEGVLTEIRVDEPGLNFDSALAYGLLNYRVKKSTVNISQAAAQAEGQPPQVNVISFPSVSIVLKHPGELTTQLSYFGEGVDAWLAFAVEALPFRFVRTNAPSGA